MKQLNFLKIAHFAQNCSICSKLLTFLKIPQFAKKCSKLLNLLEIMCLSIFQNLAEKFIAFYRRLDQMNVSFDCTFWNGQSKKRIAIAALSLQLHCYFYTWLELDFANCDTEHTNSDKDMPNKSSCASYQIWLVQGGKNNWLARVFTGFRTESLSLIFDVSLYITQGRKDRHEIKWKQRDCNL